jgi:hypothetical protein
LISVESLRNIMESGIDMNDNLFKVVALICLVVMAYSAWDVSKNYKLQVQQQWITTHKSLVGATCKQHRSKKQCEIIIRDILERIYQKHYDNLSIQPPKESWTEMEEFLLK